MNSATPRPSDERFLALGRIPLLKPRPAAPDARWNPSAFVGEVVPFSVTAFREGHDLIGVRLNLTSPSGVTSVHRLLQGAPGTDRWVISVPVGEQGLWSFSFEGFSDDYATWLHNATIKIEAGVDVDVMLALGHELVTAAAAETTRTSAQRRKLSSLAATLGDHTLAADERLAAATAAIDSFWNHPLASLSSSTADQQLLVERTRAGAGAWYEFFPRSEGAKRAADGTWRSGTFSTAAKRLPAIAAMGFDVVYLPPIHPIGEVNRKGPNNTLIAGPNDPGSPWAIGSRHGGHDAVHPDLGSITDFEAFVAAALEQGLEIALDLALQAAPDHPWVTEHPEWFTTLPDGSIAYAENPPKKYQDIYPINFDNDPVELRAEILRIVFLWVARGVSIFRVDNPHTKPAEFWEWLIAEVNAVYPDVVFLAEAFTRPALLKTLAMVGFQQSYTYFTWRNTTDELTEFLTGVANDTADFLRPNLFVNTPDILTEYLQFGGVAAHKVRAAIAATAAPVWGMYSGYELIENVARQGAEEHLNSEKYEYRPRDWAAAERDGTSIAPYISMLNRFRREHPALGQLRNLVFHPTDDEAILAFSKQLPSAHTANGKPDTVIVVANVDPHSVRETMVHLDLAALGLPTQFEVTDAVSGETWTWGTHNYVRLDAFTEPVHLLSVRHPQPTRSAAKARPSAARQPKQAPNAS
ncbi:alpha-1,4-glucan--maltose-1-phosphate maltosyltransferase [Lysinibacter cavernae]|nr:alpha-1,4-glucan--maltose-1-phosphate maltosyltransferase [Lysinibacter cavernae]